MKNINSSVLSSENTVWALFVLGSFDAPLLFGIYSSLHKALEAEELHKREFPEDLERTIVKAFELDKEPMYRMIRK